MLGWLGSPRGGGGGGGRIRLASLGRRAVGCFRAQNPKPRARVSLRPQVTVGARRCRIQILNSERISKALGRGSGFRVQGFGANTVQGL